MIKSKTYTGVSGLNYIQDSELAFATIYVVKREGTQHDKWVSGSTNRTHIHNSSTGKVSFPIVFSPGDENVFVLYKTGSGVEPEVPPGVCVPVVITPIILPDGIAGQPYIQTIYLTGTGPFVVTPINVPAGMSLTNSDDTVYISGTPPLEANTSLQFSVSNCGGGSTENFNQNFDVFNPTPNLFINNQSTSGVFINSLAGINYTIQTGSFPVGYFSMITGSHGSYTGTLVFDVSGLIFTHILRVYKNGHQLDAVSVFVNGVVIVGSQSYLSTDNIQITLE